MANRNVVTVVFVVITLWASGVASAQNWDEVAFVNHSTYQAVNADGSSAYGGYFPIRFRGIVLNNSEDWLDPTPAYDPGFNMFQMGGESEIYVQAINLDGTPFDEDTENPFNDFGGTACWMGQNYGNLPWLGDPSFSYTDEEWVNELARLQLFGGTDVTDPIRAGDLIEIRARGGLNYKGKMNVNEQHDISTDKDFELILLSEAFGLPDPTNIWLNDVKTINDEFIIDPTRQTGGEQYQSTLVELHNVWLATEQDWSNDSDIEVTDGMRTFNLHIGLNDSFDGTALFGIGEIFNVVGVFDQAATDGTYSTDGYQMLVMNANDFTAIPEPMTLTLLAIGSVVALGRRKY